MQIRLFTILAIGSAALTAPACRAQSEVGAPAGEIRPQFLMFQDPDLPSPEIELSLASGQVRLWILALRRPELDMQRLAAQNVAQAAREGLDGPEECLADLERLLSAEATHRDARYTVADAIMALDHRDSAPLLHQAASSGDAALRWLIEPVLAEWKFDPIRAEWRDRLAAPAVGRRELLLAIRGLATIKDRESLPALLKIVHDGDRRPDVRLAAAQSAGIIAAGELEVDARQLMAADGLTIAPLMAVSLLAGHRTDEAAALLEQLARDANPAVAEQALGILFEIDPGRVLPLAEEAMLNADPKVRLRGAESYVQRPNPERVHALARLLDDNHPEVRGHVREALFQLAAQPDLDEAVRSAGLSILGGDSWRGQEQAALLLGALDHEPAVPRLIELLHVERPEVMVAGAWALRTMAVQDALPELLEYAQHMTAERRNGGRPGLDDQLAHLFEAMGEMRYQPAEPLLREYVPKIPALGYHSRGAAIWALGLLHEGEVDAPLAAQLVERMNDTQPIMPDLDIVWMMSAITLGRMKAETLVPALQERLRSVVEHDPLAYAIRWSLTEITGIALPLPGPILQTRSGWFLEPYGAVDGAPQD